MHPNSHDKSLPVVAETGVKIMLVLTSLLGPYQHLVGVKGALLGGTPQGPTKHKTHVRAPEGRTRGCTHCGLPPYPWGLSRIVDCCPLGANGATLLQPQSINPPAAMCTRAPNAPNNPLRTPHQPMPGQGTCLCPLACRPPMDTLRLKPVELSENCSTN